MGGQGRAAVGDGQMEPPRMPGVMSSAGKELAEPLTEKTVSGFSWGFFVCFFLFLLGTRRPGCKTVCEHRSSPVPGAGASRS